MYHPSWFDAAACKNQTDLFFPLYNERPQARVKREAKALTICSQCPVVTQCRDYARNNLEYGIWGNETEDQRALLGYLPYGNSKRKPRRTINKEGLINGI
jgi:WhiB family redox-sensing transcriptional regulator